MRVVVDKGVLRSYVRRALRAFPKEYMASVWGRVVADEIHVCLLTHIAHLGTNGACFYDEEELKGHDEEAREVGLRWLGTIHSHPQDCAAPSVADVETAATDGELVLGICSITKAAGSKRRKVDVKFWPVVLPAETEVR